ncbi:MAG: cation transporter [Ruminococcaceae bacterium]|nr:cation transporter [Oscillospiraceae bacterium]
MKTEKNILVAFILNLAFSIFEFIGGVATSSVAIISDAVHDISDALSIGVSYFLERKSKKQPDEIFTYGYARYSVLGGAITTSILLISSVIVIYNGVLRIINPVKINYNGMILFAVIGVVVNFCAAWFTKDGNSINQKAVNLHMLEDVFGWIVVLIGAIVMWFTDISIIDPIMSIGVALFILIHSIKHLKSIIGLFLLKAPDNIDINELKEHLREIDSVKDVHHIHIWSLDGQSNYATMHIVADKNDKEMKDKIKHELKHHGICHSTLEFETSNEACNNKHCYVEHKIKSCHHHHH